MWLSMAIQAFAATSVMLIAFWTAQAWAQQEALLPQASLVLGQTAVFLAFMAQKIFRSAGTARSFDRNIWEYGLFSNRWSILAAALSILLMVIALFVPQLGMVLAPIPLIALWLTLGLFPALVEEFLKFLRKTGRLPQHYLE
jgi:hypothetical protein